MAGFMCMLRLMLNNEAKTRHRLMALSNVVGVGYFWLMACAGSFTGFLHVLPEMYKGSVAQLVLHYSIALFLYINIIGNYLLACYQSSELDKFYCIIKTKDTNNINNWDKNFSKNKTDKSYNKMLHCKRCNLSVPPRCHHCPLCDFCVLKRDHHCSFMAVCIGYNNHGYFLCFCFYTFIAMTYSCVHLLMYLTLRHGVIINDVIDVLILGPGVIVDCILGIKRSTNFMALVGMFYGCFGSGIASGGFFIWHLYIITHGITTYEARKNVYNFCDPKQWKSNFIDILGPSWYLQILIPFSKPHKSPNFMLDYWKSPRKFTNSFDKANTVKNR